jgi:hypothetical protein
MLDVELSEVLEVPAATRGRLDYGLWRRNDPLFVTCVAPFGRRCALRGLVVELTAQSQRRMLATWLTVCSVVVAAPHAHVFVS